MKKFIVAGNWKMNHGPSEAEAFFAELEKTEFKGLVDEMVIFPTALCWNIVQRACADLGLKWGLQNAYHKDSGAFTGEISVKMAKDVAADYVLIGHSERRQFFGETDAAVAEKTMAAQNIGLTPMICLGEQLADREAGKTEEVVLTQLRAALADADFSKNLVVAYEPVWAIGTGKVATPEQAQQVHEVLRRELAQLAGEEVARGISILYGGSVKPGNAEELARQSDIDGFLVGGASLQAESFVGIAKNSRVER